MYCCSTSWTAWSRNHYYWERLLTQVLWMFFMPADLCCDISCHNPVKNKDHFMTNHLTDSASEMCGQGHGRKIVHHQGILTGWKTRTPLHPGCMTLAPSNPANSLVYQSARNIYSLQCSSLLFDTTAAIPYSTLAKFPFCLPFCTDGQGIRLGFLEMGNSLKQPASVPWLLVKNVC